jgi:LacI family transcriptional regulator
VVTRQSTDVIAIEDPHVAQAVRFIRENACRPIGLRDVVRQVSLGRQTLGKRFRKVLGRTIFQEIRRVQIRRVEELLRSSDLSIERIAAEAGFEDGPSLSRAYLHAAKQPPGAYRKQFRNT